MLVSKPNSCVSPDTFFEFSGHQKNIGKVHCDDPSKTWSLACIRIPEGVTIWRYCFYSESEVTQSCTTLCNPVDWSLTGSSVHGIFQATVLEWVAISSSRGSFWPRNETRVPRIAGRHFTLWATREARKSDILYPLLNYSPLLMGCLSCSRIQTPVRIGIFVLLKSVCQVLPKLPRKPPVIYAIFSFKGYVGRR